MLENKMNIAHKISKFEPIKDQLRNHLKSQKTICNEDDDDSDCEIKSPRIRNNSTTAMSDLEKFNTKSLLRQNEYNNIPGQKFFPPLYDHNGSKHCTPKVYNFEVKKDDVKEKVIEDKNEKVKQLSLIDRLRASGKFLPHHTEMSLVVPPPPKWNSEDDDLNSEYSYGEDGMELKYN